MTFRPNRGLFGFLIASLLSGLLSSCTGLQAMRSGVNFQKGERRVHFSSPISTELSDPESLELKADRTQIDDQGVRLNISKQSQCLRKTLYRDRLSSSSRGEAFIGNDLVSGMAIGIVVDSAILGGIGWGLQQNQPDLWVPATAGIAASMGLFNAISIQSALSKQHRYENRNVERQRPCSLDWSPAENLELWGKIDTSNPVQGYYRNGYWQIDAAKMGEALFSLPSIADIKTLTIQAEAEELSGTLVHHIDIPNEKIETLKHAWLCSALTSPNMQNSLVALSPSSVKKMLKGSGCDESVSEFICGAAKRFATNSIYEPKKQHFGLSDTTLSLAEVKNISKECNIEGLWSTAYQRAFDKSVEDQRLDEMLSIIDSHDATLDVSLSAPMKIRLIDAYLRNTSNTGDHKRILMWNDLIRFLDDKGISAKNKQRLSRGIQSKLRRDFMACGTLLPADDLPCIGNYINYIAADNKDFRSQLHDQFQACISDKLNIPKQCIHPLHEQSLKWGSKWKRSIVAGLQKEASKAALSILKSDMPETKKINKTLISMEGWSPFLGSGWTRAFVRQNVRPILDNVIADQIKNKSKTSFETAAKMVQNYSFIFGHSWSLKQKKSIDDHQRKWLANKDLQNKSLRQKLKASKCSVWRYPTVAVCGSRYQGAIECSPKPTINNRVYPNCTAEKGKKCICGEKIAP